MMRIALHIDRLVLRGFGPEDPPRILSSMQREFERLFAENGAPRSLQRSMVADHLPGGSIDVAPGTAPDAVGAQLAQILYGGLGK